MELFASYRQTHPIVLYNKRNKKGRLWLNFIWVLWREIGEKKNKVGANEISRCPRRSKYWPNSSILTRTYPSEIFDPTILIQSHLECIRYDCVVQGNNSINGLLSGVFWVIGFIDSVLVHGVMAAGLPRLGCVRSRPIHRPWTMTKLPSHQHSKNNMELSEEEQMQDSQPHPHTNPYTYTTPQIWSIKTHSKRNILLSFPPNNAKLYRSEKRPKYSVKNMHGHKHSTTVKTYKYARPKVNRSTLSRKMKLSERLQCPARKVLLLGVSIKVWFNRIIIQVIIIKTQKGGTFSISLLKFIEWSSRLL